MTKNIILMIKVNNYDEWSEVENYFLNRNIAWGCKFPAMVKIDPNTLNIRYPTYISYFFDNYKAFNSYANKNNIYTIDQTTTKFNSLKEIAYVIEEYDKPIFDEYMESFKLGLL